MKKIRTSIMVLILLVAGISALGIFSPSLVYARFTEPMIFVQKFTDSGFNPLPPDSNANLQSGRLLDLYTQKGGVGQGVPGGNFTLGEVVELTVKLTFNGFPVAGKFVSFTVFSPGGVLTAILQGTTDNNGSVTENFTIPFLTGSIGEWSVIASADVAEQVVSDSLTFEVTHSVPPHGPIASFVESTETPHVDETVKFDASGSVPGWNGTNVLPITEYQWDFGDGNTTTTSTPIVFHAYTQTGIFYVKLTVYAPNASPTTDTAPVQRKDVLPLLSVSKFFTDSSLNPLSLDSNGNPKVNVVLYRGIVTSTNPGQVLAWVNVTNTGGFPFQSLRLNETLPIDWKVDPAWVPGLGAIHVFFANTSSLSTNPEITQPSTITVSTGNPQTVRLTIPRLNATAIGHPLMPGQSILLEVKLTYALKGTAQSAASYPRNYTDIAFAAAWSQSNFTGIVATNTATAFFIAYAKTN